MTFAQNIIRFYESLEAPDVPSGIGVMNPFLTDEVKSIIRLFYNKYYGDEKPRRLIFGINPGRFGAGVTGVAFTDPIRLEQVCEIENSLHKRQELSSVFVYNFIDKYGGPEAFYKDYFITSTFPLGFVFEGKNINYYDQKPLQEALETLIVKYLEDQLKWNVKTDVAYCLGKGKNLKYLEKLNKKHKFFGAVKPLPHPRWVMQYRYKLRDDFAQQIADELLLSAR